MPSISSCFGNIFGLQYFVCQSPGPRSEADGLPSGPSFVPYMIEPKIMENHGAPVIPLQFPGNMSRNIVVNFCKVLIRMV
jgi:hypothetical protein